MSVDISQITDIRTQYEGGKIEESETGGICSKHVNTTFSLGILLKWILNKGGLSMWTRLFWLGINTDG
jgi:hypothetical protein